MNGTPFPRGNLSIRPVTVEPESLAPTHPLASNSTESTQKTISPGFTMPVLLWWDSNAPSGISISKVLDLDHPHPTRTSDLRSLVTF
jgi:hypothetical protein